MGGDVFRGLVDAEVCAWLGHLRPMGREDVVGPAPEQEVEPVPHLLPHFLTERIVEVSDSPSAMSEPTALVFLGPAWPLHDSVQGYECENIDVAYGSTLLL